ncbi:hypothetical protein P4797_20775 [Priestia aryabhattai]|uniref:hypothetical protein n=1 Tax=Priestia aryabhattai TaxID=412384 RepID=UPI002E245195|nr:hypothetical protein [Priestia aryabhattai]
MEFLQHFTLESIFILILFGIITSALYEILKHILQNPQATIASTLSLPQIKLIKYCMVVTFAVVVLYLLIRK